MATWITGGIQFMMDYRDEILLAALILLFILMLILLRTVRKNMRLQMAQNEKFVQLNQLCENAFKEENREHKIAGQMDKTVNEQPEKKSDKKEQYTELGMQKKQKEEELFGKVLQEYFP